MQTEHSASVRKMFTLAREFSLEREITVHRRAQLHKNQVFTLNVPPQEQLTHFLQQLGMVDENGALRLVFPEQIHEQFLASSCCRRAYLRGAFLASGSISEPEGAYHLEFSSLESPQADLLIELLADFDLKGKIVRRKIWRPFISKEQRKSASCSILWAVIVLCWSLRVFG